MIDLNGLGEAIALIALFGALYFLRDLRKPVTLRHPLETPPCDYCGAADGTGVRFNGHYLDYLCDRCHREAEDAQVRA